MVTGQDIFAGRNQVLGTRKFLGLVKKERYREERYRGIPRISAQGSALLKPSSYVLVVGRTANKYVILTY